MAPTKPEPISMAMLPLRTRALRLLVVRAPAGRGTLFPNSGDVTPMGYSVGMNVRAAVKRDLGEFSAPRTSSALQPAETGFDFSQESRRSSVALNQQKSAPGN